jgi:hypothetical protein
VLQWAREHGCPREARTCENAAWKGKLAMLQWAREHDCPWNYWTSVTTPLGAGTWRCCSGRERTAASGRSRQGCGLAVYWGHMEVLRWAREHGAPWSAGTRDHAATNGYTDDFPLSI